MRQPFQTFLKVITVIGLLVFLAEGSALHVLAIEEHALGEESQKLHSLSSNQHAFVSQSSQPIGGAITGFFLAPVIFAMAVTMIWFNEKKKAIQYKRLVYAEEICTDVNPFNQEAVMAANQKLTHMVGDTTTNQMCVDNIAQIAIPNAIRLIREVQVLEWRANVRTENDVRTVEHYQAWVSEHLSIAEGRANSPHHWFIKGQDFMNSQVNLGHYILNQDLKKMCTKEEKITLTTQNVQAISKKTSRSSKYYLQGEYVYYPPAGSSDTAALGSCRINYNYVPVGPVTILAQTKGNQLAPFPIAAAENGGEIEKNSVPDCCCCFISACYAEALAPIQELHLLQEKKMTRSEIIQEEIESSSKINLILRIIGYFLLAFSISMLTWPITSIIGYIPLLGNFLSSVLGVAIFIAALIAAIPIFLLVLSFAWLFYHPKIGIPLLVIGILGTVGAIIWATKGGASSPAQAEVVTSHLYEIVKHSLKVHTH